jgi:hypothetical protein
MAYTDIDDPTAYFQSNLHTGNSGTNALTFGGNSDLQPDWIWIKERGATGFHVLTDVVRGITKQLYSNDNQVENTNSFSVTAIGSNGFTLGNRADVNNNSDTYVSWNWKANGSGSSNTDGSITSTVSANTTSGFSIVSYTGTGSNATIGHGLGSAPQVVLLKERNGTNNWLMSHQPLSASLGDYSRFMTLNSTSAVSGPGNIVFQNSAFTSSVFNVGASSASNGSGQNFIAYCFADTGNKFFKAGSYTGNGNADGTFVYTGFKPAWLMIKKTDSADAWFILDNKRAGAYSPNTNPSWEYLLANATNAGATTDRIDLLSNGFKPTNSWVSINESGGSYIYMAFAENPFVTSTSIPCTAR